MAVVPSGDPPELADGGGRITDRLVGAILFLPVPIVLWLFTAAPLGPLPSVLVGAAAMATHRLYARPWALSRAPRRCLWCGGQSRNGVPLQIVEPAGTSEWRACSPAHARRVTKALATAHALLPVLYGGILGGLAVFLAAVLISAAGILQSLTHEGAVAVFKGFVAFAVLPLGWLAPFAGDREGPARPPFAVHTQALLGTWSVLWLFRVVGLIWLVQATWYALHTV